MTPTVASLTEAERFAWLRLSRCGGVGPLTFLGLIQRFGTAEAALAALPRLARQSGRALTLADADALRRETDRAMARGLRFIALCEPDYPPALRVVEAPPPVLCVSGAVAALQRPMVAVVGSRNASGGGLLFAERVAQGVGQAGFVIVSGLARGVDARAHVAALASGTVAVLAGGHDRIYPPEHERLAGEIADNGGVVLSEMPLDWEPRGRDFPRRNRIVSGLSLATVVVEAARRSGSLITARLAADQGREVFAVPGSPLDPRSEGTNNLLRQGATLCTGADDILEALGPSVAPRLIVDGQPPLPLREGPVDLRALLSEEGLEDATPEPVDPPQGDDEARLLALVGPTPTSLDDLVRLSGLTAARVRTILVELELAGTVSRRQDASVVRV